MIWESYSLIILNEMTNVTIKFQDKSWRLKILHKPKSWRLHKHKMLKSSNSEVKGDQAHDYNLRWSILKLNKLK